MLYLAILMNTEAYLKRLLNGKNIIANERFYGRVDPPYRNRSNAFIACHRSNFNREVKLNAEIAETAEIGKKHVAQISN